MNEAANLITYTSPSGPVSSSTFYLHGSTSSSNHSALTPPNSGGNGRGHHQNQNPPPLSVGLDGFLGQNEPPVYPDSGIAGGGRALRVMLTTSTNTTTMTTSAYLNLGLVSAGDGNNGGQSEAGNYTSEDLWRENEAYARMLVPSMVYVGLLMLIGVPGNSLVVYVYGFQFRAATQHFLIVCLAVCDLVVGVIAMPTEIADLRFPFTFSSDFACRLLRFVNLFCSLTSNCLLVVIAVDRYRRVCWPLNHQMRMREARVGAAVSVAVSLLISWPALVIMGLRTLKTSQEGLTGKGCSFSDEYYGTAYPMLLLGTLGAGFVVMTVVLAVLYFKIWRQTRAHSSRYSHHASRSFHHHHHRHRKKGRSGIITTSQTSPACTPPVTPDPGRPRFSSLSAARLGNVSPLAAEAEDDVDGVAVPQARVSRAPLRSDTQPSSSSSSSSSSASTSLCCCGNTARPDSPVNGTAAGRDFHETRGGRDGAHRRDSSATPNPAYCKTSLTSRSTPGFFPASITSLEVRDEDGDMRCTSLASRMTPHCGCCQQTSPMVSPSAGSVTASTPEGLGSPGAGEGRSDRCGRRASSTDCGLLQKSGLLRRSTARAPSVSPDVYVTGVGDGDVSLSRCNSVEISPSGRDSLNKFPSRRRNVEMPPERSNSADGFPSRRYSVELSPSGSDSVNMFSSRRRNVEPSPSGSDSAEVFPFPSLLRSNSAEPSPSHCHSLEPPLSRSKTFDMTSSPSLNSERETFPSCIKKYMPRCTGARASPECCQCPGMSQPSVSYNGSAFPSLPSNTDCPLRNDYSDKFPRPRDEHGTYLAAVDRYSSLTYRTDPHPRPRSSSLDILFPTPQNNTREPPSFNGGVDTSLSLANNTHSPRSNTSVPKPRTRNVDTSPSSRNNAGEPPSRSGSVEKFSSLANETEFRMKSRSSIVNLSPSPRYSNGVPPSRSTSVDMRPAGGLSRSEGDLPSSKWRKFDIYGRFRSTSSTESDSISVITATTAPSGYDDTSLAGTESRGDQNTTTCFRCFKGSCNMDKITLVAFAVTLVFVVSFLPYLTLMFVRGVFGGLDQSLSGSAEINAYNIFVRSYFLNYAANPVIYGVFNARFRRECVALYKKLTSCWTLLRRRHSQRKS